MNLIEEFKRLDKAITYVLRDRTCVAHLRFAEPCMRCYGTGATDKARRAHPNESDHGCEICGGTGRLNDQDGYTALANLRSLLTPNPTEGTE